MPDQATVVEATETPYSRLEASFAKTEVQPRPNSRSADGVYRHAEATDIDVNELDFNFSPDPTVYPLSGLRALQEVFDAVQYHEHLGKLQNFSDQTSMDCLVVDKSVAKWEHLDEHTLRNLVKDAVSEPTPASATSKTLSQPKSQKFLAFFVPLTPCQGTSFGNRVSLTRDSVMDLFDTLKINPFFLLNMLGRPDYWAPQSHWESQRDGAFVACDFFCQHPRWNLHFQGAPLSAYIRHDAVQKLTVYVISHKLKDTSINALRQLLDLAIKYSEADKRASMFLEDPFGLHVMLSMLSFETSKHHVKRFQRFMWTQINKVDDHLAGLESNDRSRLSELTKQLQVISQNADSHLANADVAIITANGIQSSHERLHKALSGHLFKRQHTADKITYVIDSMKKQKIWFLNYKQRKDSTMTLVYNLVTQQDASNNIELAADMKRDSTSMNAIAGLTMAFLPGTFTATVLGAGIFSMAASNRSVQTAGLWWFWLAVTIPLTLFVVGLWWLYKEHSSRNNSQ